MSSGHPEPDPAQPLPAVFNGENKELWRALAFANGILVTLMAHYDEIPTNVHDAIEPLAISFYDHSKAAKAKAQLQQLRLDMEQGWPPEEDDHG